MEKTGETVLVVSHQFFSLQYGSPPLFIPIRAVGIAGVSYSHRRAYFSLPQFLLFNFGFFYTIFFPLHQRSSNTLKYECHSSSWPHGIISLCFPLPQSSLALSSRPYMPSLKPGAPSCINQTRDLDHV